MQRLRDRSKQPPPDRYDTEREYASGNLPNPIHIKFEQVQYGVYDIIYVHKKSFPLMDGKHFNRHTNIKPVDELATCLHKYVFNAQTLLW